MLAHESVTRQKLQQQSQSLEAVALNALSLSSSSLDDLEALISMSCRALKEINGFIYTLGYREELSALLARVASSPRSSALVIWCDEGEGQTLGKSFVGVLSPDMLTEVRLI